MNNIDFQSYSNVIYRGELTFELNGTFGTNRVEAEKSL